MKLMLIKQHEGPTDGEFKQGDIFAARPDEWVPGAEETTKWLVVQMEDFQGDWTELRASDYTVGPDPETNQLLHVRKYYVDLSVLNAAEQVKFLDATKPSPILVGRFGLKDILSR